MRTKRTKKQPTDYTGADNPQSEIRNPKSACPPKADLVLVKIAEINATHNIRTDIGEATLPGLQQSIADVGLLQPVIVRKDGQQLRMVSGHRRLEAARRAGETHIAARVYSGDGATDAWEAAARLAENVQRLDLNHVELAAALGDAADSGMSVRQIAGECYLSDDSVRRHLSLRRLAEPVARLAASGRLPVHQAELIARVGDPARQLKLASAATRLEWDAEACKWIAERRREWRGGKLVAVGGAAEQGVDDRDYVLPMDHLRKAVAEAMQGLAAAGWIRVEDADGEAFHPAAGRGRCTGCPDNTASYADQPTLFEGLRPRGSDKRGFCTHAACYASKRAAWDKVLDGRRREADKKQRAAVAKARKAGLDVCEECGRVGQTADAAAEGYAEIDGRRLCGKCEAKARKRAERHGSGGGEGYEARQKRVEELEKKFPWTAEQKLAVATHAHGAALAERIEGAITDGTVGADGDCTNVAEMVLWAQARGNFVETPRGATVRAEELPRGMANAELARWWHEAAGWAREANFPRVDWRGDVDNVPLPKEQLARIHDLETVAWMCGLAVPDRPTAEGVEKAVRACGGDE